MKFASLLLGLALASPALFAQEPGRFAAYERCRFTDGLTLLENNPLAAGIQGRTVKTVMGNRDIPIAGGTRLLYGYPGTQPFASVKVEQIPAADYRQAKQDLIANFEQILTGSDPVARNLTLKPHLNRAEIYGLDRTQLEGAVVGIYLFFVDRTHTVTTVDFLNQKPEERRFSNLDDYAGLRDNFLETYTHCATEGTSTAAHPAASAASEPATAPPAAPLPEAPLPEAPLPSETPKAPPAQATPQQPPQAN